MLPSVVFILWQLWKNHNLVSFQNQSLSFQQVFAVAAHHQEDFLSAQKERPLIHNMRLQKQHWSPPPIGMIKLNFNAAVQNPSKTCTTSVIARDHLGNLKGWHNTSFPGISNPLVAESLACRNAIQLSASYDFRKVIIEGDSQIVINKCLETSCPQEILDIIRDILSIKSTLKEVNFNFIRGICNGLA
ncbi:uncharacterized protein LOC131169318 [Hevea brasiliensis]|uniref:uncharacterized protein LOC131169318 n=1 Tax=Hevea brasiliensis TaxID=3981 RepID=UPI0025EA240E|nr:uncharacterized protein LOC131169318 [Hevea brasiliensis]